MIPIHGYHLFVGKLCDVLSALVYHCSASCADAGLRASDPFGKIEVSASACRSEGWAGGGWCWTSAAGGEATPTSSSRTGGSASASWRSMRRAWRRSPTAATSSWSVCLCGSLGHVCAHGIYTAIGNATPGRTPDVRQEANPESGGRSIASHWPARVLPRSRRMGYTEACGASACAVPACGRQRCVPLRPDKSKRIPKAACELILHVRQS